MSEWKPGDVALLSVGGEEVRALVVNELGLAWRIAGHRDWWPNLSSSSRGLKWDVDFMAVRILSPGVES